MNTRSTKKFENNFSQTFELDRLNRFIKDMRDALNNLQNEYRLRYLRHFTLNLKS